jgi:hypothetical protein
MLRATMTDARSERNQPDQPRTIRILLVEDNPGDVYLLEKTLQNLSVDETSKSCETKTCGDRDSSGEHQRYAMLQRWVRDRIHPFDGRGTSACSSALGATPPLRSSRSDSKSPYSNASVRGRL